MIVPKRNSLNKVLYLSLTAAAVLLQTHNAHATSCTGTSIGSDPSKSTCIDSQSSRSTNHSTHRRSYSKPDKQDGLLERNGPFGDGPNSPFGSKSSHRSSASGNKSHHSASSGNNSDHAGSSNTESNLSEPLDDSSGSSKDSSNHNDLSSNSGSELNLSNESQR